MTATVKETVKGSLSPFDQGTVGINVMPLGSVEVRARHWVNLVKQVHHADGDAHSSSTTLPQVYRPGVIPADLALGTAMIACIVLGENCVRTSQLSISGFHQPLQIRVSNRL